MGPNKHIILYVTSFKKGRYYFVLKTLYVIIMYRHVLTVIDGDLSMVLKLSCWFNK